MQSIPLSVNTLGALHRNGFWLQEQPPRSRGVPTCCLVSEEFSGRNCLTERQDPDSIGSTFGQ